MAAEATAALRQMAAGHEQALARMREDREASNAAAAAEADAKVCERACT
jgi:hypothetical protein